MSTTTTTEAPSRELVRHTAQQRAERRSDKAMLNSLADERLEDANWLPTGGAVVVFVTKQGRRMVTAVPADPTFPDVNWRCSAVELPFVVPSTTPIDGCSAPRPTLPRKTTYRPDLRDRRLFAKSDSRWEVWALDNHVMATCDSRSDAVRIIRALGVNNVRLIQHYSNGLGYAYGPHALT